MALEQLEFNEEITYDNGIFKGVGIIVGIAVPDKPLIGCGYMVKDLSNNLPNKTYPYDTFLCFEIHLSKKN